MLEVIIRFTDIPDRDRNAGWLCAPHPYKEGDPLGRGATMREAFLFMLDRIESEASEKVMRAFGKVVVETKS